MPAEINRFYQKLAPFYSFPGQLIFLDETSKDGRSAYRRYARSLRGTPALVNLPSSRGKRVSVLAGFSTTGFFGWNIEEGTYDREKFHNAFMTKILPKLNPWPLPRSIVILDNAKIHMYPELEQAIHHAGYYLTYHSFNR